MGCHKTLVNGGKTESQHVDERCLEYCGQTVEMALKPTYNCTQGKKNQMVDDRYD